MDKKTERDSNAHEKNLADELKKLCDENGKEKDPTKSAAVLHKLGLVYKERSPNIMCLIKSAALLNAAITRNPNNVSEIQKDLQMLCRHILCLSGAKQKDADLIKEAENIKRGVEEMREKVNERLEQIQTIPDDVDDKQELEELECMKVNDIQSLQNEITNEYKQIMISISDYCIRVMGEAPCTFVLAGMGSMARSEITPYSDFESIILLKEGCQRTEHKYQNVVLPFFRWFAVIFQVVVINLKETILPAVNITSLNNTTSIKRESWFFDAFTTCGVSFDGMMPHACKSPLGRQEPTTSKPWKTELIKPVSEMLKYLDTEQDLKNGYHLSDILTKTCFVYGEKTIYDQFSKGVATMWNNCDENTIRELIRTQTKTDMDSFNTRDLSKLEKNRPFNIKKNVYRSTTIFISALGRLHRVPGNSCFEILRGLKDKRLLNCYSERKLQYGVAIACEVRLRLYMKSKGQNDWINMSSAKCDASVLIDVIGQSSAVSYFQIAYSLQSHICRDLDVKKKHLYSDLHLVNMTIYGFLEMKNEQLYHLEICSINSLEDFKHRDVDCCLKGFESITKARKVTLQQTEKVEECRRHDSEIKNNLKLFKELYEAKKYDEAIELGEVYFSLSSNTKGERESFRERALLLFQIGDSFKKMGKYKKAESYLQEALKIEQQITSNKDNDRDIAITLFNIGICLLEKGEYNEATSYLKRSLKIQTNHCSEEDADRDVAVTLNKVGKCLMEINQHSEAMSKFQQSLKIKKKLSSDEETDIDIVFTLLNIGDLCRRIGQIEEAKGHLQKSVKIIEQNNGETGTDKAFLLNTVGICFLEIGLYKKAMQYFQDSLTETKRISLDEDSDRVVARTLNNLSLCLAKMSKHEEAMTYLKKSLVIERNISSDEEKDNDMPRTLHHASNCAKQTG